jgi:hypothetical protein
MRHVARPGCIPFRFVLLSIPLLVPATTGHAEPPPSKEQALLARFDAVVKPSDRQHWSYQPVRRPAVPKVKNADWVRNPVDAFVLSRLEAKGWQPSPAAGPRAQLRRVHFDLVGLPPTLAEQEAFLRRPSPQHLDRVIDDLLARPAHGERWARHWLDLVRYAETNGYERDATKPHAWRYRDYVIRALNGDKPFDRFILEQLAGDELPDAGTETLVATGYLRLGPWDDEPADPKEDRFDQLDDMVSTTSQVFLGLTLGCARCHNHKFEPLTMHDYYRLVAVFAPLRRPRFERTELDLPIGTRQELEVEAERDRRIAVPAGKIAALRSSFRTYLLESGCSGLPEDAAAALLVQPRQRTALQKTLAEQYRAQFEADLAASFPAALQERITALESQIQAIRRAQPGLPRGYFLHETSPRPPATHLLFRGKATRPGPRVEPGVPNVLAARQPAFLEPDQSTSRRRLSLARWIASPDNPLTARVIVNRVWQFHFGEGLVTTPSDFGVMGEPPTHPELLDWLTAWFVQEGWSLKKLHRLILTSNAYRMSKRSRPEYAARDPENALLWRVHYRRLEVEAIRDAVLAVSGRLNPRMYGPSMYPEVPREALAGHSDPDKIWKPLDEKDASRRTIYAFIKRSLVVPMLEVLDLCDTVRTSAKRVVTTVAPQALTLMNGAFVNRQAGHFANRLVREAGPDPAKQVERAYRLALCRPPTAAEQAAMLQFLKEEAEQLLKESVRSGKALRPEAARRKALEQMCRVIFNLNEFVYTD